MTKKISIILKQNYPQLGEKGKISKVSQGYALNYLIPKNIAEIANKNKIKHITMFNQIANKQKEKYYNEAIILKNSLDKINHICTNKKQGENNLFFGSINEKDIMHLLTKYTGKIFEKKQIKIQTIKNIGITDIQINIANSITCAIKLYILPENI
uniref:50S ribosomal protein L9, chloroplastic n=1 Tax=Pleonosporium borreri TaxID=2575635 RepID=A0A4D6WVV4_9FLOR|nr:ribosomal protein L9 [Pleonosporium borreri]